MALSPWPSTPMALRTATAELRTALGLGVNATVDPNFVYDAVDAEVQRLGASISARVEDYAPDAPDASKDEAVIRGAAWLRDTRGALSRETVGPLSIARPANSASWFLHSGAASLLTNWKIRRAGLI